MRQWLGAPRALAAQMRRGPAAVMAPQRMAHACRYASTTAASASHGLTSMAAIQDWRVTQWEMEKQRQQLLPAATTSDDHQPIKVTLSHQNGTIYDFDAFANKTCALDILTQMHTQQLPKIQQALAVQVRNTNGKAKQVLDLRQPFGEDDCTIEFLDFSSDEGKKVFWHSSAHVLGQALESKFAQDEIKLTDGPALQEGGFFYEMFLSNGKTISDGDFGDILKLCKQIVKQKQPFEKLHVTRQFAQELFKYSEFKLQMLDKIPEKEQVTLYRCGPLIDLCRGPHVPHTGVLSSFEITRCGASHWEDRDLLQRVYGISFPTNAQLKDWQFLQEEAKKRDHRVIGKAQQLFLFHPLSPGSSFFLPHGTRIFNKLANFIRDEYVKRGYDEVITPLIFKKELWETSGHLQNYKEDMFMVTQGIDTPSTCADHTHAHAAGFLPPDSEESDQFGLKPMNCPGHCLLFRESKKYSYRELPVRFADFSALHRNEASGALTGLTRVRRFHQDDAHIFCTADQVQAEISHCLAFIQQVYGVFGFQFQLKLSTRPEKNYMGEIEVWENAETQLKKALLQFGQPWTLNEGDGAFYGPKIDIVVLDALGRHHQCGTIQLDFQLPKNFELSYDGADGKDHTPIIIHRAVLGSIERMMAILIEHTGGKWPMWLSPRQVAVVPVAEAHFEYASQVAETLMTKGKLFVDVQASNKTLNKRIREAQLAGYNYILVVGDQEQKMQQVNVRTRDNQVHGAKQVDVFLDEVLASIERFE